MTNTYKIGDKVKFRFTDEENELFEGEGILCAPYSGYETDFGLEKDFILSKGRNIISNVGIFRKDIISKIK